MLQTGPGPTTLFRLEPDRCPPLVTTPPATSCQVCVVVPVRDEAQLLWGTLQALACQVDPAGRPFERSRYEILVLANNCRDDSAAIARRFGQQHPDLQLHVIEVQLAAAEAHIGRVRQMLLDEASRRLHGLNRPGGVIASTDGDTCVSPTWLTATLAEFAQGADAVGGRILTDPASRQALDPHARKFHLLDVGYQLLRAELESRLDPDPFDPWPRHFQHYGASFALSAEIYRRVGGLPAVRSPEDVVLYRRLMGSDARFRHSPAVRVFTSARALGRTNLGLAAQLSTWQAMGERCQSYLVESARTLEARFLVRRQLRQLWQGHGGMVSAPLARRLGVPPGWLSEALATAQSFGSLWETVLHQTPVLKHEAPTEIRQALGDLRLRLAHWRATQNV